MATRRTRDTWGFLDMLKGKAKEAAGAKRGDENARRHEREERSHQGT